LFAFLISAIEGIWERREKSIRRNRAKRFAMHTDMRGLMMPSRYSRAWFYCLDALYGESSRSQHHFLEVGCGIRSQR